MKQIITANRYHDICCGHRVFGHESKCAHLHGHNYRIHFEVTATEDQPALDSIGRVIDFSVIKSRLCDWLENRLDHKFLIWKDDPEAQNLKTIDPNGVIIVAFNPTAENIAKYLVEQIAPVQLEGTGVKVISCKIEETAKCSATYKIQ